MGRSHPRLPSGHWAGRGHPAWPPPFTCMSHHLPKLGLSPGDTVSWCDTSRHGLQDPRGKHPPWWATARSGPGPGAGTTLVRAGSPQQASPGTAPGSRADRQTDSNVSTHGQLTDTVALSPPHPGLTPLTSCLHGGSAPSGCRGPLAERGGQPSSWPSPAHGSAPAHLPLPDPGAAGRGCCPVPPGPAQLGQQHPSPAPKHAGFSMQLLAWTPQGPWAPRAAAQAAQPRGPRSRCPSPRAAPRLSSPSETNAAVPFIQPSSSCGARAGLSKKRQERGGRIKINDRHR